MKNQQTQLLQHLLADSDLVHRISKRPHKNKKERDEKKLSKIKFATALIGLILKLLDIVDKIIDKFD